MIALVKNNVHNHHGPNGKNVKRFHTWKLIHRAPHGTQIRGTLLIDVGLNGPHEVLCHKQVTPQKCKIQRASDGGHGRKACAYQQRQGLRINQQLPHGPIQYAGRHGVAVMSANSRDVRITMPWLQPTTATSVDGAGGNNTPAYPKPQQQQQTRLGGAAAAVVLDDGSKKRVRRLSQRVNTSTTTTTTTSSLDAAGTQAASPLTPKTIPLKRRSGMIPWYLWLTWVWLGAISIIAMYTLLSSLPQAAPAAQPVAKSLTKTNPHHVKVYPFNLYEGGSLVRYPRDGGIPQLDWASVKHFEACCRDDTSLHCFTASELALKRDPARTAKNLPDVYMEISLVTTGNTAWVQVGSRCQLIWSTEKADVEDS